MYGIGNYQGYDDIPRKNKESIYKLTSINGIKFNQLNLGVGLSLEKWNTDILFPVFVSTKVFVLKRKNSPFLFANIGYTIAKRDSNLFANVENGNLFVSYGLGYQFRITDKLSLYSNASILHQKMNSSYTRFRNPYTTYKEEYRVLCDFLSISIGVEI